MSDKKCESCVYYRRQPGVFSRPEYGGTFTTTEVGECRIGPPQPTPALTGTEFPPPARWPLVWADDWCGAHTTPDPGDAEETRGEPCDGVIPIRGRTRPPGGGAA